MDMGDMENLNKNEQKILNLGNDATVRKQVLEMKDQDMSKEERISRIRKILSEKNIEYTERDAELFESIIRGVKEKRIKMNGESLDGITGGAIKSQIQELFEGVDKDQVPTDIQEKIDGKKAQLRREKIIAYTLFGLLFAGVGGIGYLVGHRKSSQKAQEAWERGWEEGARVRKERELK